MKRRRKVLPKVSTAAMRQLYLAAFGDPMPRGWHVEWKHSIGHAMGRCCYGPRAVFLSYRHFGEVGMFRGESVFETLIHEFVHLRCGPEFRHGPEFNAVVRSACEAVGLKHHRHRHASLYTGREYRTAAHRPPRGGS